MTTVADVARQIVEGSRAEVGHWYALQELVFLAGGVTEDAFDELLQCLRTPGYLGSTGAYIILHWVLNEWQEFTAQQRSQLLAVFVELYPSFASDDALFEIAEIIGEHVGEADAMEALRRLQSVRSETARAYVAHSLEHLVARASSAVLGQAKAALLAMAVDPSEVVRNEVADALQRLRIAGR